MRLPLPLPLILAVAVSLIFGALTLPLLFGAFIWPERRLVDEYWPGAGDFGGSEKVVWTADAVTYFPSGFGRVTVKEHSFTRAKVRRKLPCG
ncbi:MAG: hypothetical protein Q4C67_08765 [Deinococcus sp.]|nr:hypothetical protein [Deinococcus sp.]